MPSPTPSLLLYDISSPLQPRSYAPNPSKSRLALRFKGLPFATRWVDLLDVEGVRRGVGVKAGRQFDNGEDYYTLPMLQDQETGEVLGDSFDIANWLDDKYPEAGAGRLFPRVLKGRWVAYESPARDTQFHAPITTNEGKKNAVFARFNLHVDATFSAQMVLYGANLPFNPATAEAVKVKMCARASLPSWESLTVTGDARETLFAKMESDLKSLGELFENEGGMWLEGEEPCYADLIVGGWLNMLKYVMPEGEWAAFRGWQGGVWGRVWDGVEGRFLQ